MGPWKHRPKSGLLTEMVGLAAVVCVGLGVFYLHQRHQRRQRLETIARQNNCLDVPRRKQRWYLGGLDLLIDSYRHTSQHKYLQALQAKFRDYGNTYTSRVMGMNRLVTIEPANVEAIVKTKAKDFIVRPARRVALDGLVGPGILTCDGWAWKVQRTLMKPSFDRSRTTDMMWYEKHTLNLLRQLTPPNGIVDLQDLFFKFTLDASTDNLFGSSSRTLEPTSQIGANARDSGLEGAFDRSQRAAVRRFALGWLNRLIPQPRYWLDTTRVHGFADRYVRLALEHKTASPTSDGAPKLNFLTDAARRTTSHDDLRRGVLHLLVAGRDSTASLLSNLWHCLARDERVWTRLKLEVDRLEGVIPCSSEVLKQLPYLRRCIDEALRCHPAIPWSLRSAARDTVLPTGGGPNRDAPIVVPAGTSVLVPLYCMHRNRAYWGEDADLFMPEQWEIVKPGWNYLPFLAGPRMCLGYQSAINTASFITIRLVQHLKAVRPADDQPWREELGLSMACAAGVKVVIEFR
ncbi:hypothetical protein DOTSEDRAFT_57536 [Dothistroma septosporum NZE10]|uniref:Cytochrome P450 n=1 Tax=Dothistroma septosporum (strain NZE10 / CBS 128990) TaxID=675120 RepID=N1PBK8_DOTSN|nr:hypothetical protein DOTSEDRAFT_57536 [Dothistroma septosporum NZE10]